MDIESARAESGRAQSKSPEIVPGLGFQVEASPGAALDRSSTV